ncbi:MAG TPA: ATP-binding protein [Mycobacteriales bacterium]
MITLPVRLDSASRARQALDCDLLARGIDGETRDDTLLIVSELVTNAIRHGRPLTADGTVHVDWTVTDRGVAIEVTDGGGGLPLAAASSDHDEGGRGLAIVDALATRWGVVDAVTSATTVWACVACTPTS